MLPKPGFDFPVPPDAPKSRMLWLANMTRGGLIYDASLARRFAELLLEFHYGKDEVERQRPLITTDKGDHWQVDGSWNRDGRQPGIKGHSFLSIRKYDGQVMDFGLKGVVHPDPRALEIIKEEMRKHQSEPER
jgi:hypothetical protein